MSGSTRHVGSDYCRAHCREDRRPLNRVLGLVNRRHHGQLAPVLELEFDDPLIGVKSRIAEVLMDPDRYVGETLADPLEGVRYGRCKAKIMAAKEGGYIIHSFAHGSIVYRLTYDEAGLEAIIDTADVKSGLTTLAEAMVDAMLDEGAVERVRVKAAKTWDIGLRAIDKTISNVKLAASAIAALRPRNVAPAQTCARF